MWWSPLRGLSYVDPTYVEPPAWTLLRGPCFCGPPTWSPLRGLSYVDPAYICGGLVWPYVEALAGHMWRPWPALFTL